MYTVQCHEVHVWYVFSDRVIDPGLLARYEAILTPEELTRRRRFVHEKDRHQYLLARALVRTMLSHYVGVRPEAWSFTTNRYGRPELAGPVEIPLRFNISHTRGLVACAVARDREIGVDVENVERPGEYTHLAQRFFAPPEAAHVTSLPVEKQRDVFFDYWTLKESYIKARGMGLALPLSDFAFRLTEPPTISFTGSIVDDPNSWQFHRLRPSAQHRLALAVRGTEQLEVTTKETVPAI